jgi:GT2 family glycosyltransferase
MTSPVALFVYNRLPHTQKTIEALQRNRLAEETEVFIFSDAPKNGPATTAVREVRDYIRSVKGFGSVVVVERPKNLGLAGSIIDGVTQIVNKFGKVIVVEDDLVTSPFFLEYMNQALDLYENDDRVISVHGYMYPIKVPIAGDGQPGSEAGTCSSQMVENYLVRSSSAESRKTLISTGLTTTRRCWWIRSLRRMIRGQCAGMLPRFCEISSRFILDAAWYPTSAMTKAAPIAVGRMCLM